MRQPIVLLSPEEIELFDRRHETVTLRIITLEKGLEMANAALQALEAQVAETNGVIASAVTFIQGLSTQLAAVQAELADLGVTNATLDALATGLDESEQALAAAIAATPPPAA